MSHRGIALLFLVSIASARPAVDRVLHAEPALPQGWRKGALLQSGNGGKVAFMISLKQPEEGLKAVRSHALRASTPSDPLYGHYMSSSEVISLCRPTEAVVGVVKGWLAGIGGCDAVTMNRELLSVECTVEAAQAALHTTLWTAHNQATKQSIMRAGDYYLPSDVKEAVTTVYGLHGLPLPPRNRLTTPSSVGDIQYPANVTPAVLAATYNVGTAMGSYNVTNRQAVAAFQGETMNSTDLATFFKMYVPSAAEEDAKVYAFQGDPDVPGEGSAHVEASLDIQTIMGVAPKILTEFWYYSVGFDLCQNLKIWAGDILAMDNPPLVHSSSYGWQGNLAKVGCLAADVQDVDEELAKLAAIGITLIFSSGDSGAGYDPFNPSCPTKHPGTALQGTVDSTLAVECFMECCIFARNVTGFTYHDSTPYCEPAADTALTGTKAFTYHTSLEACCQYGGDSRAAGYNYIPERANSTEYGACSLFVTVTGSSDEEGTLSGTFGPPSICETFSEVTGTVPDDSVQSGGDYFTPGSTTLPVLSPSWPASSTWVTAVGATRFVDQTVGQPEMASDQFGSGGGFSTDFAAFKAQRHATAGYLKKATNLPPKGSFPVGGRGSADISALGEGYQIIVSGVVTVEGGTSAATPMFAGLVSLLNEQRLAAGMPPMGYLNPWIYANPQAFTDVTLGTNAITRRSMPVDYGFECTDGWDPATGLGTPLFDKMLKAALAA